MKRILLTALGIVVLLTAGLIYLAQKPHLRLDPLTAALLDAPVDPGRSWRSEDVMLVPHSLAAGQGEADVLERLADAGFVLEANYTSDAGPPDRNTNDDFNQADIDQMHQQARTAYAARGITHVFSRDGRFNGACGETLVVEIGLSAGALNHAAGYSRWTCL